MSSSEVKCPEEFFLREERRRPRFLMDVFSLALLVLGVVVFGMACYVFFGSPRVERTTPSALSSVDQNTSQQNVLNHIELMVKQLLRNSEAEKKPPQDSSSDDIFPFPQMFQPINDIPSSQPVRTRLIFRFGLPPSVNSLPSIPETPKIPLDENNAKKEPVVFFTQSKFHFEPSLPESSDKQNSQEQDLKNKTDDSKEATLSEEGVQKPGRQSKVIHQKAVSAEELDQLLEDAFKDIPGFSDPIFNFFKPHFTSVRHSSGPFMMRLKNDEPTKAPETNFVAETNKENLASTAQNNEIVSEPTAAAAAAAAAAATEVDPKK